MHMPFKIATLNCRFEPNSSGSASHAKHKIMSHVEPALLGSKKTLTDQINVFRLSLLHLVVYRKIYVGMASQYRMPGVPCKVPSFG